MITSSLTRLGATAAALAATLGLVACAGSARSSNVAADTAPTLNPAPADAVSAAPAAPGVTEVARPTGPVQVFASPTGASTLTLPPTTSFGSARSLVVIGRADGWLNVLLPTRPNGSIGWIRADGVAVRTVATEVRVDLSDRSLEVLDRGSSILQAAVAVGTAATPTPPGRFFVVDKVDTGSSSSAYGPFALGLSGYSNVLDQFGGGDGQIAIHGTNAPASIGTAASFGCIRVPNDVVTRLADLLALGTPVLIVE